MANSLNPSAQIWEIDTASSAVGDFMGSDAVYVKSVRWIGATTAGHQAIVKDADGKVLVSMVATGANNEDETIVEGWWQRGFQVPTLGSGKLYIDMA